MISNKRNKAGYFVIAGVWIFYVLIAAAGVYLLHAGGTYPVGNEVMNHVYKGESLYHSIGEGSFYPLYDRFWCNGVEPLRYGAVLPYYVLALCQFVAGGSSLNGYLIYIGLIFLMGASVWLYIGVKRNRILPGVFAGIMWFFMPDNLYSLFAEGDLTQALATAFLPLVIHLMCEYLFDNNWKSACKIIPVYSTILLCGINYACIILAATVLFLVIYRIMVREKGKCLSVLGSFLVPFPVVGIWLYAMFQGDAGVLGDIGNAQEYFQDAAISFNPFYRLSMGNAYTYIGLVAVFGIFFADKKIKVCCITAFLLFIGTLSVISPAVTALSDGFFVQMLRYVPVALCLVLYGILLWKNLRRWICILICLLVAADAVLSFGLIYTGSGNLTALKRQEYMMQDRMIQKAADITSQRIAIFDENKSASDTQYLLAGFGAKHIQTMCAAGAEYASVSENVSMLGDAAAQGYYEYLFDRCLELGNDSVLLNRRVLANGEKDMSHLTAAAELTGYELVSTNTDYVLYHIDTYETFGTICQYNGLGIGEQAAVMSLADPDIEEGVSVYLDDYTYEELDKYKIIYLAGFQYHDKDKAEKLVRKLAGDGVRVVIAGDGMPADEKTRNREFLGVICQDIMFENGYPLLYYNNREYDCALFERNHRQWSTVYFTGLDKTKGYLYDDGRKLDFLGTAANDNIYFVGLNLTYHYVLTHDAYAGEILQNLSGSLLRQIPDRTLEELLVEYDGDNITITSGKDDVNTSIAYQQEFADTDEIYQKRNLVYVNQGTVTLTMDYPYMAVGMMISVGGIILAILYGIWMKKRTER